MIISMRQIVFIFMLNFMAMPLIHAPAAAQEESRAPSGDMSALEAAEILAPENEFARSVVFLPSEYAAIQNAISVRGLNRTPTGEQLASGIDGINDPGSKPPPEAREIKLGGIVYRKNNDWTIWLNGQRVTPDALPEEIVDLKVLGDYIEMKWFDRWTNAIIPLRMRPHQRFNIDSRIFLPG